ncbi:MAG: GWxTD domain-containing protein [Ignavibacteriales bacterium]|nr:GWxTD domain-containing protein [Ignavibacteriales bacterium]
MEFQFGESKKRFDRTFRVLWPDRPRSLMDIDLAVDALQHIASENEMAAFRTFSDTRSVRALFDFWRKKDPDTLTAYNGIMAEYYRRVDVANQQFSSQRSPDGYKSDRGRIYILYGAPANTERLFSPHHPPREIWTYGSLQRRFVFEDQAKNGVYVLVAAEEF